jgi:hypothetical protein
MLPHVQREKNKRLRKKRLHKEQRQERAAISRTQQKKRDREARIVTDRAERRLKKMDSKWGFGLGPIKVRLKWMRDLLGR